MKKYLKERYISKTTGRLLWKKIINDSDMDLEPITSLIKNRDYRQVIYDILNDVSGKQKVCKNKKCNNLVRFINFSRGYSKFCCIKCSKNPEEIEKINSFGGKNKIRKHPHTEKTLYFKKAREYTRMSVHIHYAEINPHNYPIGRCGIKGAYQIDHKISIKEGYDKNIDPEIIGSVKNLQTVPWRVNSVKGCRSNVDLSKIVTSYKRTVYDIDLPLEQFIEKYCVNTLNRVKGNLCKQWFKNRNSMKFYDEIYRRTSYLPNHDKTPKRILLIRLGGDKIEADVRKYTDMLELQDPTRLYVKITECDLVDYEKYFFCFDKSINNMRVKSNITKKSCNKRGLLHLWYKYK